MIIRDVQPDNFELSPRRRLVEVPGPGDRQTGFIAIGEAVMRKIPKFPMMLFLAVCALTLELHAAPPDPEHTIYLVRHGSYNPDPKIDAERGPGLNALGIAQARLVAARLRGLPFHFDSITSSTMTRARETATIIHDSLNEVMFGGSARFSECTPPAYRKVADETPEDQANCAKRLDEAFAVLFVPARTATRNNFAVAHGNVIRYFVKNALNAR